MSGRKCYSVMMCEYDGIKRPCSRKFEYFGLLAEDDSEEAGRYRAMIIQKLDRKINGLKKSGRIPEAEFYGNIREEITKA